MDKLFAAIEEILFEHHNVTVPQLGTFLTQAKSVEISQSFISPEDRVLSINPDLVYDDKVLTQYIADKHNLSLEDATDYVNQSVSVIIHELTREGEFPWGHCGSIVVGKNGKIVFQPNTDDSRSFCKSCFGLMPVSNVFEESETPPKVKKSPPKHKTRHSIIKVFSKDGSANETARNNFPAKRLALWTLLSVLIITGVYFLIPSQAEENGLPSQQVPNNEELTAKNDPQESSADSSPANEYLAPLPSDKYIYRIVIGSALNETMADRLKENAEAEGVNGIFLLKSEKGNIRLTIREYGSRTEADHKLDSLRKVNSFYDDAWVLRTEKE